MKRHRRSRIGCLAATIALAWAGPASSQAVGVTAPGNIPNIGNVTAGVAAVTDFRVTTGGAVSAVTPGGGGSRQSSGTVANTITLTCSGGGNNNNPCNTTNVKVTVKPTTTQTLRAQAVKNLTIAMGTAVLAANGSPTYNGQEVTFTIQPIGRNSSKTFRLGLDLPITGGFSASGLSTSSYQVQAGFAPNLTASGNGAAVATVRNGTLITKTSDLSFGSILPLNGQSGTVSVNASTGERTSSNPTGVLLRSGVAASRAVYSINSEGGQIISVSVPTSFTMTGPGNPITVNLTKTATSVTAGPGGAGTAGTAAVGVGGSFNVTGPVTAGTYTGTFNVTFTWN